MPGELLKKIGLANKDGLLNVDAIDFNEIELQKGEQGDWLYHDGVGKDHELSAATTKALEGNDLNNPKSTGIQFLQNAVDPYVQGASEEKKEEYLGGEFIDYNSSAKVVTVDVEGVVNSIEKLAGENFTENEKVEYFSKFSSKFEAIRKDIAKERKSGGLANNAEAIQNARLLGWLTEQLHIMSELDKNRKNLEKAKADLEILKKEGDATYVDVRDVDGDKKYSTRKDVDLAYKVRKLELQRDKIKTAREEALLHENYEASDLENVDRLVKADTASILNEKVLAPVLHMLLNPFLAGLATSTEVGETALWGKIAEKEKTVIKDLFRRFGLDHLSGNDLASIRSQLEANQKFGLIDKDEVEKIFAYYEELAKQGENKKKFLDDLQASINKFNDEVQKKIKNAEVTDDDLNKLRIIQAFLLISPLCGVSILPLAINVFAPFFEGQEIAEWLGSMFQEGVPLGWLGFPAATDALQIDEAVKGIAGIFGNIFSLPEAMLTGENNPVAILFRNVVGQGLANSPFGNWVLAACVEAYSHYFEREAKLQTEKSKILENAKKGLDDLYRSKVAEAKSKGLDKNFDPVEFRANLAVASDISVWLQEKHLKYPDKCEEFIDKVFSGDESTAKKIKGFLQDIKKGQESSASEDDKKKADKARSGLLDTMNALIDGQKNEKEEDFQNLLKFCYSKNIDAKFFNSADHADLDKRWDRTVELIKDVKYEEVLSQTKAEKTLELAGQSGIDTGYPPCYGEQLLYLDLIKGLKIDPSSELAQQIKLPAYDESKGVEYDKNLLDDLILLNHLKNNNSAEYNKVVQNGIGDSKNLKEYLDQNHIVPTEDQNNLIATSRNTEAKRRVVAIQTCLEIREQGENQSKFYKDKSDDELYEYVLSKSASANPDLIDRKYENVKQQYKDRIVEAAEKLKESGELEKALKLTPNSQPQPLSVGHLVESAQQFGR